MNNLLTNNVIIRYADFLKVCCVEDTERHGDFICFGGFILKPDGLYVVVPGNDTPSLAGDRIAVSWHPTGHYDLPALSLPCTVGELRYFVAEAGLLGCVDEDELKEVIGTHAKQSTAGDVTTGKTTATERREALLSAFETAKKKDRTLNIAEFSRMIGKDPSNVSGDLAKAKEARKESRGGFMAMASQLGSSHRPR